LSRQKFCIRKPGSIISTAVSNLFSAKSARRRGEARSAFDLTVEFAIAQAASAECWKKNGLIANGRGFSTPSRIGSVFLELQNGMKIRMVPVGPTFHRFARSVRDTAPKAGSLRAC